MRGVFRSRRVAVVGCELPVDKTPPGRGVTRRSHLANAGRIWRSRLFFGKKCENPLSVTSVTHAVTHPSQRSLHCSPTAVTALTRPIGYTTVTRDRRGKQLHSSMTVANATLVIEPERVFGVRHVVADKSRIIGNHYSVEICKAKNKQKTQKAA